jgi:hypothetical protein
MLGTTEKIQESIERIKISTAEKQGTTEWMLVASKRMLEAIERIE